MGLIRNKDLAFRLGEFASKEDEVYYGGSPLAINSSGEIVLAKSTQIAASNGDSTKTSFIGISWTTSENNELTKSRISTVLAGPCLVTLCKLTLNSLTNPSGTPGVVGDDYPYVTTDSWQPGDEVFINTAGKFTNTASAAADPYYGFVRAVGSDWLEVWFYGTPVYKD